MVACVVWRIVTYDYGCQRQINDLWPKLLGWSSSSGINYTVAQTWSTLLRSYENWWKLASNSNYWVITSTSDFSTEKLCPCQHNYRPTQFFKTVFRCDIRRKISPQIDQTYLIRNYEFTFFVWIWILQGVHKFEIFWSSYFCKKDVILKIKLRKIRWFKDYFTLTSTSVQCTTQLSHKSPNSVTRQY